MTLYEERIKETAKVIRERDHARAMVKRWEQKLADADATLAAMLAPTPAPVPEPEPIPVPE